MMKRAFAVIAFALALPTVSFAALERTPGSGSENTAENASASALPRCSAHLTCPDGRTIGCIARRSEPGIDQHCMRYPDTRSVRCWETDASGNTVDDFSDSCE
jgi:hypothetical protein